MIVTPEYWPPISHVAQWYISGEIQLQFSGTYQKQSYLNRCSVAGVGKSLTLSVPLISGREQKTFLQDVLIDNSQRWAVQHLRTLRSCYGKAPFFEYYFPFVENLLQTPHYHLAELNRAILELLMKFFTWQGDMQTTTSFIHPVEREAKKMVAYIQVFSDRQPFLPDLSILDLLFCLGPGSKGYLLAMGQQFSG